LPDAEYKFFLTASLDVRARRRYDELLAKGQTVSLDKVAEDIRIRDENDSFRSFAPLKQAGDAIRIDSTDMTAEEVADCIVRRVKEMEY